jgi:cyclic pyranopterin phosphate synthase
VSTASSTVARSLVDGNGRVVTYLRLSLTERCNLRCAYCVPEAHEALPGDWMSDDEVVALVAAMQPMGLRRVRLTGGEPTLRPRLPALVARLAGLGLDDLSLTSNASRLAELAQPLRQAGLHRLNLSLDTLDAGRFAALCGDRVRYADVRAGLDAAAAAGFAALKLNVVALAGVNDDELPELARFAWARGMTPRFIELMPMSEGEVAPRARFVPAATIRARLAEALGALVPDPAGDLPGVGPARYLRVTEGADAGRRLGVIAAVTEKFCAGCNRIRVSARGRLHACLGIDDPAVQVEDPLDLRAALARGPEALRAAVGRAVLGKAEGHGFVLDARALLGGPRRAMIVVGG